MRISDLSSDVCSSDLKLIVLKPVEAAGVDDDAADRRTVARQELGRRMNDDVGAVLDRPAEPGRCQGVVDDQGNAGFLRAFRGRTSVVKGQSVSVRVDLGGRRIIKKKKKRNQDT